jgi:hypothetical protein
MIRLIFFRSALDFNPERAAFTVPAWLLGRFCHGGVYFGSRGIGLGNLGLLAYGQLRRGAYVDRCTTHAHPYGAAHAAVRAYADPYRAHPTDGKGDPHARRKTRATGQKKYSK